MEDLVPFYAVKLQGAPDMTAPERIAAEVRFAAIFEELLGGAEGVAAAFDEDESCFEEFGRPTSNTTALPQSRWDQAIQHASELAASELGIPTRAAFVVEPFV